MSLRNRILLQAPPSGKEFALRKIRHRLESFGQKYLFIELQGNECKNVTYDSI